MSDAHVLKNLAISETGFVFDPRSGATYTLNPTGLAVVAALREGASLDDSIDRLRASFQEVDDDVRNDVIDFLQVLRQHGLLPPDFKA
jgi:PqqD family protein of HPr-rel-A system